MLDLASGTDPLLRKRQRPSNTSIAGSAFWLLIPVLLMYRYAVTEYGMDLRYRSTVAVMQIQGLKLAVAEFADEHGRLPTDSAELGADSSIENHDSGYYEVEKDGVIRIRFTASPEMEKGSIVMTPVLIRQHINWECHPDGDIARAHLPAFCRQ